MDITNLFKDCCKYVRKLQIRIAKAMTLNKFNRVRRLCRILTNSFYAKILSIWKVINNKGGKTPGVDREIWTTALMCLIRQIHFNANEENQTFTPDIYTKKKRQTTSARDPNHERPRHASLTSTRLRANSQNTRHLNSYGFRKFRCRDALNQIYRCLCQKSSATWIFEADIKGCFDNISHEWLLKFIPMDKRILRKWLKCGYIELGKLHPTTSGTPQGGIISPTLINLTLDGLQKLINKKFPNSKGYKVNFIRYADDFVITAASREIIEKEIVPLVTEFLAQPGLSLFARKNQNHPHRRGFRFFSNNRKYNNGKFLQKPAKKAIVEHKHKLHEIVFKNLGAPAHKLSVSSIAYSEVGPTITGTWFQRKSSKK